MLISSYVSEENLFTEIPNQNSTTKKEVYCFINWALYIWYAQDLLLVLLPLVWIHYKAGFFSGGYIPYLMGKRPSFIQEQSKSSVLVGWSWAVDQPWISGCVQGNRVSLDPWCMPISEDTGVGVSSLQTHKLHLGGVDAFTKFRILLPGELYAKWSNYLLCYTIQVSSTFFL